MPEPTEEFRPTREQLTQIKDAGHRLANVAREAMHIQTDRRFEIFGMEIALALVALERALNPRRFPFGQYPRGVVVVQGWPEMMKLSRALAMLKSAHDSLIKALHIENVATQDHFGINGQFTQFTLADDPLRDVQIAVNWIGEVVATLPPDAGQPEPGKASPAGDGAAATSHVSVEANRPPLNETDRKIAGQIDRNPGQTARQIGMAVGVGEEHVRRVISKKLKHYGYTNPRGGEGYQPPSS